MAKRKAKPESAGELTPAQVDEIWEGSSMWRGPHGDWIGAVLSGDDAQAAKSYLRGVSLLVEQEQRNLMLMANFVDSPFQETLDFLARGLARYFAGGCTLGQAFGVERAQRGPAPARRGAVVALSGLIRYLHDRCGYSLSESRDGPSAFDVASQIIKQKWGVDLSTGNIKKTYWTPRPHKPRKSREPKRRNR